VSGSQLLARLGPAALPSQPLPVQQVGAGQVGAQPGPGQALDRLAVQALGGLALAQQRPAARLDTQPQSVPAALVIPVSLDSRSDN
jgi:hypothetical protein